MRNPKLYFLFFLLVIAFIPYLIICFYALPFADDFCFGWTASENISFLQKVLKQYLHWNGRYTSDVLVNLHPLTTGSLLLYQLASFISVIAAPIVFFVFIRQWVAGRSFSIIPALFISLFYLCYLPNITEGVYWYIGLVNYHLGALCFILQMSVLFKLLKMNGKSPVLFSVSLLLLIVAVGFNEIGAALIPVYYLAAIIHFRTLSVRVASSRRSLNVLIIHFAVAFTASAFVVCSPGNFARAIEFPQRFNFIHSVFFAGLQTIRFVVQWTASIPFILLSLLVMVNADKVECNGLKKVNAGIWLTLLLFTVFIAALIPYLATGILGQHRTMNYIFPFFILLWIALLLSLSTHYGIAEERTPETTGARVLIMAFVALLVISVSGNSYKILNDFRSGAFTKYRTAFMERQSAILFDPRSSIPALNRIPHSFQIVDAKSDTAWWVDKCMKKFYTETNIIIR